MTATSSASLVATASVVTDDPSRYLLQLCKHFEGKLPVEFNRTHGTIAAGDGCCVLDAVGGMLNISIAAPSAADLEQLKFMVAKHLAKFDRHDRLNLSWDQVNDDGV